VAFGNIVGSIVISSQGGMGLVKIGGGVYSPPLTAELSTGRISGIAIKIGWSS